MMTTIPTNFILCAILFIALLLDSFPGSGQGFDHRSDRLDSLIEESNKPEKDTSRVKAMLKVGFWYLEKGDPEAKTYATKAVDLSTELSYTLGIGDGCQLLGHAYRGAQPDSAIFFHLESLRNYQAMGRIDRSSDAHWYIAEVYMKLGDFEEAKKHVLLFKEFAEQVKGRLYYLYRYRANNGMGIYYVELGSALEETDSLKALETFNKAIPYLLEAEHYADSLKNSDMYKSYVYNHLANIKTALGEYDEALTYALPMLKIYKSSHLEIFYPKYYTQITDIYLKMGNYQQAIDSATQGLEWSRKLNDLHAMSELNKVMCMSHQALGNYKEAVRFGQRMFALTKQIYNKEREEQIAKMQMEFDTEQIARENELLKREAEIAEISLKRQRIYVLSALGLVLLIAVIMLLIYKNLLNKKHFAEKVQELQTAQAQWFTNIAHELRTPLTLILGPVRHILKGQLLPASVVNELEMVRKSGEQLTNRVNEILEVSRMESGKLIPTSQPVDLIDLTRNVVDSFQSMARQQRVALSFFYNTHPVLNIDSHQVSTILNNLLSNALKFTPSGGTISIGWDFDPQTDTYFNINVSDTGIGIPEKDLPHIFERFYQVSHSKQPQSGGSGVGLAFAQELARLHGGHISVSSEENQGTTFVLSLPKSLIEKAGDIAASESGTMEHTSEPGIFIPPNSEPSDQPTILLVEDQPDMRQYISKLLGEHYRVIEVSDGQQALEMTGEITPDLIISDVMMPVMDGLTLAKKLKEDPKHKLIPFITITAHANERDRLMAYRTGVDDYMLKPFDADELLARIENLLSNALERKKAIEELLTQTHEADEVNEGEETNEEDAVDEVQSSAHEDKFIKELEGVVKEHLANSHLSIHSLADQMAMSESSLNRLLKKMTGLAPGQFIRDIRLQEAMFFLETRQYKTISEVAYAVGFEDASSFTRLFKRRFGKSPKAYLGPAH